MHLKIKEILNLIIKKSIIAIAKDVLGRQKL